MKRWIFWSFASVATFLVGSAIVFLISIITSPVSQIRLLLPVETPKQHTVEDVETAPPTLNPGIDEIEVIDEVENWRDNIRSKSAMKLFEIGEGYHGDEVPAKNGEIWLGLFKDGESYCLRQEKLRVTRVYDPVVDGDEKDGERTGKSVDVVGSNKPLFLIKGANDVTAGKVLTFYRGVVADADVDDLQDQDVTLYNGGYTNLDKDYQDTFMTTDNHAYQLKVIKAKNKKGQRILALALSHGETRQILYTTRTWEDAGRNTPEWSGQLGTLFWVGDIDRDGKPDLYAELYYHDNVSWRVLFLSSKAGKGQHVGLAAEFATTGC